MDVTYFTILYWFCHTWAWIHDWLFFISSMSLLNISGIFSIHVSGLFIQVTILFSRSWIIFIIIILNSFSYRLLIYYSFFFFFLVWWVFTMLLQQPQRPLGLYQQYEHLNLGHFRTRTQKEMAWENTWGDNSRKIPPNREENSHPSLRILHRINPRRNTPRHILIKLTKLRHK